MCVGHGVVVSGRSSTSLTYIRFLRYHLGVFVWSSTISVSHVTRVGRLCAVFDKGDAYRLDDVSVVCGRSSTSLLTDEF